MVSKNIENNCLLKTKFSEQFKEDMLFLVDAIFYFIHFRFAVV